jgi:hypothetical protein
MTMQKTVTAETPVTLMAIARAAHLAGDRELERYARRELEKLGMSITFRRRSPEDYDSRSKND